MKLVVVGLGQCGGRLADEFVRLGKKARFKRGIDVITSAYAVNTDQADLAGLHTIRSDFQHRILIGGRKTAGHGVGKINEVGAAVAKEDSYKIIDAVRTGEGFYETASFLIIAGAAGGTGSGGMPIIAKALKERYPNKAVYCLAILPFEHEERTEERVAYNVATCLKSTYSVADAVILCDNERFLKRDVNLMNNMERINQEIVAPFLDLLCAGEEVKRSRIGAKTIDTGDIIQTLEGWTAIGLGRSYLPMWSWWPFERLRNFRKKGRETQRGLEAVDQAISELSVAVSPKDAGKVLYMLSAPSKEMNVSLVRELGSVMKEMAEDAVIRSGDYPRAGRDVSVTLIFSKLSNVPRLNEFYRNASRSTATLQKRQMEAQVRLKEMEKEAYEIPALIRTAEEVAREADERWPLRFPSDDSDAVDEAHRGRLHITDSAIPKQDDFGIRPRATETAWLESHIKELSAFAGEWLVVEGEELIAHSADFTEAVKVARSRGVQVPYIVRLPLENEEPFIG